MLLDVRLPTMLRLSPEAKQFLIYYELMAKIGTIFEDYNKRTSKIINAHRDVLSKHKLNKTRDIFDTHELEIIKTTLNLFNTVKTLCMKNLLVKNNDAVELNPEFNEKFIDGVRMIADKHNDILEKSMPKNFTIILKFYERNSKSIEFV